MKALIRTLYLIPSCRHRGHTPVPARHQASTRHKGESLVPRIFSRTSQGRSFLYTCRLSPPTSLPWPLYHLWPFLSLECAPTRSASLGRELIAITTSMKAHFKYLLPFSVILLRWALFPEAEVERIRPVSEKKSPIPDMLLSHGRARSPR